MRNPPSIIFLIPYFGQWPFWMPFFIESCRCNPDIDWLLIGDCAELEELPSNVRQQRISFEAYCDFVSTRLGFEFAPINPYKLCDLKPALGFIHEPEIQGYDYWGFSDLDLVYGNLRAYFTAEKLRRSKFFSTHERRVSGHLCLLRNEQPLRELFWRIPDFQRRVQDQKNHALDEGGFTRLFLWRKNFPKPLFRLVGLFNPWRRMAEFKEAFSTPNTGRAWTDGSMNFPQSWSWHAGRLRNDRDGAREFPYLHFLGWKRGAWKEFEFASEQARSALVQSRAWRIDQQGFHPLKER
ncbi:DUF6625 family protein [Pseudomonas zhanjiangensis]|uniref:DUF6625 family protein n=1 Tax=Pseudomonas zhanjiangensis TaxID=3239015 RepID=A0ABV3YQ55_9PSED